MICKKMKIYLINRETHMRTKIQKFRENLYNHGKLKNNENRNRKEFEGTKGITRIEGKQNILIVAREPR